MARRLYHFALPAGQADALIELANALDSHMKRGSLLDTATNALDEQMAKQDAPWERCENCKGSGWVEGS